VQLFPTIWAYGQSYYLNTPSIDIKNASSAALTFWHKYDFIEEPWSLPGGGSGVAYGDGGMVFLSTDDGSTWDYIEPVGGYPGIVGGQSTWVLSGGNYMGWNPYDFRAHPERAGGGAYIDDTGGLWVEAEFDLTEFTGNDIIISFRHTQNYNLEDPDGNGDNFGDFVEPWFIDDIEVTKEPIEGPKVVVDGSDSVVVPQGTTYSYVLRVYNWKGVSDYIDLEVFSDLGWPVELLDYNTYLPLTNNGGDPLLPDVGPVPPDGGWVFIRMNITVPFGEDWDVDDTSTVWAFSGTNSSRSSRELVFTSTPNPDVGVSNINLPAQRPPGNPVTVTATIENFGDLPRTFQVQCTVEGSVLTQPQVFNQTGDPDEYNWVNSLNSESTVDITWSFTPTIESPYTITVTTLLDVDQNQPNNSSSEIVFIQVLDWEDHMDDGTSGYPGLGPSDAQDGLWTVWDNGGGTLWELGSPTVVGPVSAYDGAECWGTEIDGDYTDNAAAILHTPFFDFATASTVTITFYQWYELTGNGAGTDYAYFGYNEDAGSPNTMTFIDSYSGNSLGAIGSDVFGWIETTIEVTSIAAGNPNIRFSWMLEENGNYDPGAGYYIDNVSIRASRPGAIIKITEFQDNDGVGDEFIEVYNSGDAPADLVDYSISIDDGVSYLVGTWIDDSGDGFLDPGEYGYFVVNQISNPDSLDDEGGRIVIVNTTIPEGFIQDDVEYGQRGLVPDPVTGESVTRFWDGLRYTDDWARETIPSINSGHIGNRTVKNPLVVINEVYFNPSTGERFIELIYAGATGDPDVDIVSWIVVVDGIHYTIPAGPWSTILNSTNNKYVINESMALVAGSDIFSLMDIDGDNVYLYNSTGSLVDLVGWSDPHSPGTAIARVPDGNGVSIGFKKYAVDGYDDESSIEAGWSFISDPTMGIVVIEKDQTKVGDTGDIVEYTVSIVNHGYVDIIDLYNFTIGEGWLVEFLDETGTFLLTDTNGNGVIDTGSLSPNEIVIITVRIYIPLRSPGNRMTTVIDAIAWSNNFGRDRVTLITETFPHIEVDKYADPLEIWINGAPSSYQPQDTKLTLNVSGAGLIQAIDFPQDVVFCVDNSESMTWNDPTDERVAAAKSYVDNLTVQDRGAVVLYNDLGYLVDGPDDPDPNDSPPGVSPDLSNWFAAVKANIDETGIEPGRSTGTAIGNGLILAVDQLINNGNSSHTQVIILLTDGVTLDPSLCYQQAKRAAANGIVIYTIGLEDTSGGDPAQHFFLEYYIANVTGGKHYPSPDPSFLLDIFADIQQKVGEIAGKDLILGDDVYMIQDVLPPWIRYVPGTFIDPLTGDPRPPDNMTVNATGYTFMRWEKQYIKVNETWQVTFDIRSDRAGFVLANDVINSRVNYTKWNSVNVEDFFPEVLLFVKSPMPDPPELRIINDGTNVVLDWTPPSSQIVDYYLIYRSTIRDDFGDFTSPWINTSLDSDTSIIPDRVTWNDTTASASPEYYYIIRVVNSNGEISPTSNTVGKYDKGFNSGISTFSLPLEPSYSRNASWYISQLGSQPTDYIKWKDPATHGWVTHYYSDGDGVNDTEIQVGEGYEINLSLPINYSFWGMPATSVRFLEGEMQPPGNFDVRVQGPNVYLSWDFVPGADHYIVYRATSREMISSRLLSVVGETAVSGPNAWIDFNVHLSVGGNEFYYVVGAVNSSDAHTTFRTTYAIGVWMGNYTAGYHAVGLPVKTFDFDTKTLDSYCDDIPDTIGMNYYIETEQRWGWHRINMPEGAFDDVMGYTKGYQLSTTAPTVYYFVGQ
jgi:hypothetical protein